MTDPYQRMLRHTRGPETEREALTLLDTTGTLQRHRELALELVRRHPGWTSAELAAVTDIHKYAFRPRLTDLMNQGLLLQGPKRRCRLAGTSAVTWFVREALEALTDPREGPPEDGGVASADQVGQDTKARPAQSGGQG